MCVCVGVWRGRSCDVKSIISGRKLARRAFESFVSFQLLKREREKKRRKKELAAANLILLLQGKRGPDQQEKKERGTERGREVRISNVRASVFWNMALNESKITHDQSAEDSCFVPGVSKANTCSLIMIIKEKNILCMWIIK